MNLDTFIERRRDARRTREAEHRCERCGGSTGREHVAGGIRWCSDACAKADQVEASLEEDNGLPRLRGTIAIARHLHERKGFWCRLEHTGGNHFKFYEVTYDPERARRLDEAPNDATMIYGRIGSTGQRHLYTREQVEQKIDEKLSKGYRFV